MQKTQRFASGSYVKLDTTNLERIQKQLGKRLFTKVGVIGSKAGQHFHVYKDGEKPVKNPDPTNAELGAMHEEGVSELNIPPRSWLKIPLTLRMPGIFRAIGQKMLDTLDKTNIEQAYKKLGVKAEAAIQMAFATRGFGNWAPNAKMTKELKGSDSPLIDTGQLRQSVTSGVFSK